MIPSHSESNNRYHARINRVVDYIKNNIEHELSLDTLAEVSQFSKFYFHRIFKSIIGENLNGFINRSRVEKAAFKLLNSPQEPVSNIAYDVGFSSPSTFSRAFKSHFTLSPSEWREKNFQNSKICKVHSNHGQTVCKSGQLSCSIELYIDSRNNKPIWRINMKKNLQHDAEKNLSFEVKVEPIEDISIAYIRHQGAYKANDKVLFQQLFGRLMSWAIPRNLFEPPKSRAFTVYSSGHPDITEPDKLTVDVCISVDPATKVSGEVGMRNLPGGNYAVVELDEATQEECAQAWDSVFNHWLPESGYQPGEGAYFCEHLNNPEQHPEGLYKVAMYLPVKPL
ncbi:GyrI-like domain-containing protein [Aliikangiella sp. G2MR2-5]|uniref:AraC family transcriptional regulator n=1 Tax=Aliikangiella sp. G2MR2-5 TaxID=2788943 RepID=UPI0018AC2901|nr:GyrI-like domain-containing protein [Aliikangiella sp. G2MR2-5]